MRILFWSLMVSALHSCGQTMADDDFPRECRLNGPVPKLVSKIREMPSYFAKVTADGRYMCYIAYRNNIIMDLTDPDTRVVIPGPYDPVPAPPVGRDRKVAHMSAPSGDGSDGLAFYQMQDIINAMKPGEATNLSTRLAPKYKDEKNDDNYQSIGVLPGGSQEHPIYRVLTGSLTIDDYDTSVTPWKKVRHIDDACGPEGIFQLPMLSKSGQELAVYDTRAGTTKILGIHDDGSCEEKLDLGYPTGKVEFSYDGNAIAFHVDSFSSASAGKQFSGVAQNVVKNVYKLDLVRNGKKLKAGALRRLTNNRVPGEGSYYPSFTQNGEVVYVHGEPGPSGHANYSFQMVDTKSVPAMEFDPTKVECVDRTAAQFALGSLWSQICSSYSDRMSAADSAMWTLSLDPMACRKLVRKNWDQMKERILQDPKLTRSGLVTQSALNDLTTVALENACPSEVKAGRNEKEEKTRVVSARSALKLETGPQTGAQVYSSRCRSCHNGTQARTFRYDSLTLDEINNMLIEIDSGDMPRENVQNREAVLKPLVDELLSKRTQAERGLKK